MAHTFGAHDEYGDRQTDRYSGYLWGDTPNSALLADGTANPDSVNSLMKTFGNYDLSDGALKQIGWTDTDDDTIPDILDTFPTVTADTSGTSLEDGRFRLSVDASVTPLESPDPTEGDYTINTLAEARYRLDDGDWIALVPDDGGVDEATEEFALVLDGLSTRGFAVNLEVLNSVGNATTQSFTFGVIPEPLTLPVLAGGLLLAGRRRKKAPAPAA